jgi:hypothetical protein
MQNLLTFYESHKEALPDDCRAYAAFHKDRLKAAPLKALKTMERLCAGDKAVMANVLFHFLIMPMAQSVDRANRQMRSRKRRNAMQRAKRRLRARLKAIAMTSNLTLETAIADPEAQRYAATRLGPASGKVNEETNALLRTIFTTVKALRLDATKSALHQDIAAMAQHLGIKNSRGADYTRQAIARIVKP